ncbi:hypothetical protein GCM10023310_42650 [Paenibacillus vulneris]|uniref:Uncharacterized protein n=1 Tax=Paenibacillus vulneris TaxID=1133364 RepID=A0ABW3UTN7_9BACL
MKYSLCVVLALMILFSTFASTSLAAPASLQETKQNAQTTRVIEQRIKPIELKGEIRDITNNDNGESQVSGNVTVMLRKPTNKNVEIGYKLYSVDENKHTKLIESKNLYDGKIENRIDLTISLKSLNAGDYQLKLDAQSIQSQSSSWGDNQILYFSVNNSGLETGFRKEATMSVVESTYKKGELFKIKNDPSSKIEQLRDDVSFLKTNSITAGSVSTSTNIAGTFKYNDRNGNVSPWKEAKVIIYARDQFYIWRTVGTTYTDSNGYFSTYFDDNGDRPIKVAAYTINNTDAVADFEGYVYVWALQFDVFGGGDFGTAIVSEDDYERRAIWSFEDIVRTRTALTNAGKNPGSATVLWEMGSNDGTYYNLGGEVHLKDSDPDSDDTTIHELGHNYMYNLYNGNFPSNDCPSPHYFEQISGKNCAWTEGWADFLPLYINNDSRYNWSPTQWTDVETRGNGSYDYGDQVEGNVAGALWDLYDTIDDGSDMKSYPFNYIYTNMWFVRSNNFREYWDHWLNTAHYDADALGCIDQNTMDY